MRTHRSLLPLVVVALTAILAPRLAQPEDLPEEAAAQAGLSPEARRQLHVSLRSAEAFKVRIQAAILLGRRGTAKQDLGVLTGALLHDEHFTVRGASAMAIANLGHPAGIESLLGALDDSDSFVRKAAREGVSKLAAPESIAYLELARQREDPSVRLVAVEALSRIETPEARKTIAEFLGDSDAAVRRAVELAIEGWEPEQAVEALLAALSHPNYPVRADAARLAARYPHPRLVEALADRLTSALEEPRVQLAAATSLESLRELLDVEDLVKRVQGLVDRDARVKAITLLGFAGGPRALDVLTRSLSDPDVHIRGHAVMALGRLGDSSAAPHLARLREDQSNERIRGVIRAALRDLGAP